MTARASTRPAGNRSARPADTGLPASPAVAPKSIRSRSDLRAFQRLMTHALIRPLDWQRDGVAARWEDGRRTADVIASFIKPNDRLTAVERLDIYARCYWYRVLDSFYEDTPGLRGLLGEKRHAALARAYLAKNPSRSFTLRNLCARLADFIVAEPRWTAPHTDLASQIARFEWAQTTAFDGADLPPLTADDIADAPPARLRVSLQPHVTLLALDWPVDDYVIAIKRREAQRAEASNTVAHVRRSGRLRRVPTPRRRKTHVVVHRLRHRLYYKQLPAPAFAILAALGAGRTLPQAIAAGGPTITAADVREWFSLFTELGWLCRR